MYRLLMVIFALTLVSCKSSPDYLISQQLTSQYKNVGFVTFRMESQLAFFQADMETFYRPRITEALQDLGFQVVDASRLYEVMEALEKDAPGLFNPNTGQKNSELENELFIKAMQQVKQELNLDAFLFAGVDAVRANFSNNLLLGHYARWYGQSEVYLADGVDAGAVLSTLFTQEEGYLPGARLYLRFRDGQNNILSVGSGGIELLARYDDDGEIEPKTSDYLFDDKAQLAEALDFALEDLASHKSRKK
ncbi:MAG: hypothetical protein ABNH33_02990 [Glaciecola sp.]